MALAHCSFPLCSGYATHRGRCKLHADLADRERGTSTERGYQGKRWTAARKATLRRDPVCTCPDLYHGHEPGHCLHLSQVADHYPKERKDLIAEGVKDPDHPSRLRGLCRSCHSRITGKTRPGGFADRFRPERTR